MQTQPHCGISSKRFAAHIRPRGAKVGVPRGREFIILSANAAVTLYRYSIVGMHIDIRCIVVQSIVGGCLCIVGWS